MPTPGMRGRDEKALRELLHRLKPKPAGRPRGEDEPPEPPAALTGNPTMPKRPGPGLSAAAAVPLPEPEGPPVDAVADPGLQAAL